MHHKILKLQLSPIQFQVVTLQDVKVQVMGILVPCSVFNLYLRKKIKINVLQNIGCKGK